MVKIKKRITAAGLLQALEAVSISEVTEAENKFGSDSQAAKDWRHVFSMVHAFLEVNKLSLNPCLNKKGGHHEKMYNDMVKNCEQIMKIIGKNI